ncbi:unannotated protein [freshwater metagenome]|uniref:Unannotated protein n=1 Tax=freshwater metagenome TaxID=449393 RepID=A0A6J7JWN9_9ZZZZ
MARASWVEPRVGMPPDNVTTLFVTVLLVTLIVEIDALVALLTTYASVGSTGENTMPRGPPR